jgi:peptidoglycan/xylan/chitin deacetylase (PgdA/CDA1 family)
VTTQLVAEIRTTSGTLIYTNPVNVPPATAWTQASWTFTTPANASTLTIYHLIQTVGSLDTDDTSLVAGGTTTTTTTTTTTPPSGTTTTTTTPPSGTTTTTTPPSGTTITTAPAQTTTTTTTPPSNRPVVYLTFDDGPGPDYTPALLDVLGKYPGVRVTFFPVGGNVRSYPTVAAQIITRGHDIGNHSDSHPDLTTLTAAQITTEITRANDSIFAATGVRPTCVRPPYGYTNATVSTTLAALGMSTVLWTHDTNDWRTDTTTVQMIVNTLNTVSNGSIVLMHDWAPNTLVAVDQWLAANSTRFEFRSLPQC